MVQTTFKEAKAWLEEISEKDTILIVHDVDADGICAGLIMYAWCNQKKAQITYQGYVRGKSSFKDFNYDKYTKVIILDLAEQTLLSEGDYLPNKPTLYIDHHIGSNNQFSENIKEYKTVTGICTSRSAFELTNQKEWLGIIGAYSDAGEKYKENDEWFAQWQKSLDMPLEEFKEEYVWPYGNLLAYFKEEPKKAFEIFKDFKDFKDIRDYEQYWGPVREEIQKFVKLYEKNREKLGIANYFYFEPEFPVKSAVINNISFKSQGEIFIFVSPTSDGNYSISTRCQGDKVNLNDLLQETLKDLPDAKGGGHARAAGGKVRKEDLEHFKKNVITYLEAKK